MRNNSFLIFAAKTFALALEQRWSGVRVSVVLVYIMMVLLPKISWILSLSFTRGQQGQHMGQGENIPFTVCEKRTLDCQYGTKYYKSKEHSSSRVYLQGTRKIGCRAHIEITEYPEYKVNTEVQGSVSNKAMRKMKEERLCELRNALENGEKAVVTKKFFVSLPTAEAHHQCHPTGREVAMAQRVHPKIVDKIHELVLEGVIDPLEVQRHLKHYVCHSLCSEQPPDILDRAYHPELQDIRNHINKAKQSIQLSY